MSANSMAECDSRALTYEAFCPPISPRTIQNIRTRFLGALPSILPCMPFSIQYLNCSNGTFGFMDIDVKLTLNFVVRLESAMELSAERAIGGNHLRLTR